MILDDLAIPNLTYDIVEASSRIGGRVYTHRFSQEKHDYYDVGAMRYPDIPIMQRAFDLFERIAVPQIPYLMRGTNCPQLFNDWLYRSEIKDPFGVSQKNGGDVPSQVVGNEDKILRRAVQPYQEMLQTNFEKGFNSLMRLDDYSTREYLLQGGLEPWKIEPYNFHAVEWMETQSTSTNYFYQSFSENVIDSLSFHSLVSDLKWVCIDGGSSLITDTMAKETNGGGRNFAM
ncbi:hypothetical protein CDD81_3690 [Ophiocordyceps australis]|uniref:Amine oxidase domain-containing protein n=1 Tax=Ophiocordyceps australis TaxID=1399860 RepID=A0A2C5XPF0_9HYPO|nr:hypothetical protein CDD81_3690 [Ophiocordyceps australis]